MSIRKTLAITTIVLFTTSIPAQASPMQQSAVLVKKPITKSQIISHARQEVSKYGWNTRQHKCLVTLWNRESGWNYKAKNKSSGAYGIPQSLPASKMASAGKDWRTNPKTQIKWGLKYIKIRYQTPCKALSHSNKKGWY
jgi:hypothetical protein